MLSRITTYLALATVVASLGIAVACPKSEPPPEAPRTARIEIEEPVIVGDTPTGAPSSTTTTTTAAAVGDAGTPVVEPAAPPSFRDEEAIARAPDDTTDFRARGDELMKAGRPLEAVIALRTALSTDDGADIYQKLGDAYVAAGDVPRGALALEEAVARDVGLVAARKTLARYYLAHNDGVRARAHADELVRLAPTDAQARQLLGRALLQQKMWQQAIDQFALVVDVEPDNGYAHNNLGFAALQIGKLELAREHLERCLSLEPQEGFMLNNLGVAYERLGRHAEAHAAFSRAAELSPKYVQAFLNRDRLQASLSQDERIVSAETLLKLRDPVSVPVPTDEYGLGDGGEGEDVAPADGAPSVAPGLFVP